PTGDPSGGIIEITVDAGATLTLSNTHIFDAEVSGTVNVPANSSIETINSNLAASVASGAILKLTDENVTGTIDDQGTVLITTSVPSGGTVFNNVVVDDDATVNVTTSSGDLAGIEVASGATLTLEGGTQIEGGTQSGSGDLSTLTIDSGGALAI